MAFAAAPALPPRRLRRASCRRTAPRAVEANTLTAVATAVLGLGGGIALVAWTETQGKRTEVRANVQVCVECRGDKVTPCTVCGASGNDPLDGSKQCSYCEGEGKIKCFNCAGSGVQPRFLDRLSPDDFMD